MGCSQCLIASFFFPMWRRIGGFQIYGANVQFVAVEGAVDKIESGGEITATDGNFGQAVVTGGAPGEIPCGQIEVFIGLIEFTFGFQSERQVVKRLGIAGVVNLSVGRSRALRRNASASG